MYKQVSIMPLNCEWHLGIDMTIHKQVYRVIEADRQTDKLTQAGSQTDRQPDSQPARQLASQPDTQAGNEPEGYRSFEQIFVSINSYDSVYKLLCY